MNKVLASPVVSFLGMQCLVLGRWFYRSTGDLAFSLLVLLLLAYIFLIATQTLSTQPALGCLVLLRGYRVAIAPSGILSEFLGKKWLGWEDLPPTALLT